MKILHTAFGIMIKKTFTLLWIIYFIAYSKMICIVIKYISLKLLHFVPCGVVS